MTGVGKDDAHRVVQNFDADEARTVEEAAGIVIDECGRLNGKVAFVTGGNSGIGRAIALRYAEEGATVVVASRGPKPREGGRPTHEIISAAGGTSYHVPLDVCDSVAVDRVIGEAIETCGDLDVMTCSAGTEEPIGDSREVTMEAFDHSYAVNVRGIFACARAALRHFVPRGSGKVVAVSSIFGRVGVGEMAAYCASKAAAINLIRSLAVEHAATGVTLNVLCPGSTRTQMAAQYHVFPEVEADFRAKTPLRLPGDQYQADARDIAHAALFLSTDESRFMTGAELIVDGGWTAI